MKKFLAALTFAIYLFSVNFCSAAKVNVCDFGVDTFINRYNNFANQNNDSYFIEKPKKMKSDDKFDNYGVVLNAPAKIVFIFNVGKDGCIALFTMANYLQNNEQNFSAAVFNALSTVGATPDEISKLTEALSKNSAAYQWIGNINRNIYAVIKTETSNSVVGTVTTLNFFAMQ